MQQNKCILLAGTDNEALTSIKHLIIKQQQNIDIVVCQPVEILQQVKKFSACMVIFLQACNEKPYTGWIKELRENTLADEIPVYIYTGIPSEEDIANLLQKI